MVFEEEVVEVALASLAVEVAVGAVAVVVVQRVDHITAF